MNAQNNSYWSSINQIETSEVSLHDQKIGVWCALLHKWKERYFSKTLLIQSGMPVTFFGPFSRALQRKRRRDVWSSYARWNYSTQ
jgi:hypothetical protein